MNTEEKLKRITNLSDELKAYAGVHLGKNVVTEPNIYFDISKGPIVVGDDTRIFAGAVLRGPLLVGKNCRLGGEIAHSIIGDYTNKGHHGFLGHSYVGSWVNLGGGTSISDLKNTYGTIKMRGVDTGLTNLGAIIGDYVKTAINTSIFCGKIIGESAHLYGTVTEDVSAFTSHVAPGKLFELPIDLAIKIQRAMAARRDIEFIKADEEKMRGLFKE